MQIVIDIQDDVYRVLKEDIYPIPDTERLALVFKTLVKKGTPLPKGHGRLIDADKICRHTFAEEDNLTGYGMTYSEMGAYNDGINDMYKIIKRAPTIIEADKEVENESTRS